MMNHVSKTFHRLLQNLKYLYESNGINYDVQQYYDTLMRLLTPYELLSHFHIVNNRFLFKDNDETDCKYLEKLKQIERTDQVNLENSDKKWSISSNQSYNQDHRNQVKLSKMTIEPKLKNKEKEKELFKSRVASQLKQSMEQVMQTRGNYANVYNKCVLGDNIERKIVQWVAKKLLMHEPVKMKDIAAITKILASDVKNFKSSLGWVTKFLLRNPYLKKMIKYCKHKNYEAMNRAYQVMQRQYESGKDHIQSNQNFGRNNMQSNAKVAINNQNLNMIPQIQNNVQKSSSLSSPPQQIDDDHENQYYINRPAIGDDICSENEQYQFQIIENKTQHQWQQSDPQLAKSKPRQQYYIKNEDSQSQAQIKSTNYLTSMPKTPSLNLPIDKKKYKKNDNSIAPPVTKDNKKEVIKMASKSSQQGNMRYWQYEKNGKIISSTRSFNGSTQHPIFNTK